jgi:hypothetical protein
MEKDELKAQIKSLTNEVLVLSNRLLQIMDERDIWHNLYLEEKHYNEKHQNEESSDVPF